MVSRLSVNMNDGSITKNPFTQANQLGGRGLISHLLTTETNPALDPLGPENMLVLGTGLLGGTGVSTSGRLSIGAKSPLTGTIKESNVGGTAGFALSRLGIKALTITGATKPASKILVLDASGNARLDDASTLQGLTTYDTVKALLDKYGSKNAVLCVGPGAEHGYRTASIMVTDMDDNPARAAGRGGMGLVFASKGLKAIVISKEGKERVEPHNPEEFKKAMADYVGLLQGNPMTSEVFPNFGTAFLVGVIQELGALPTRNFSTGNFDKVDGIRVETMEGLQKERSGKMTHACQPGCLIRCSNVYNDKNGEYLTSGLEYETIVLNGSNTGISDFDYIATIDRACDEIGIDTIETGATIAVAMETGLLAFGDNDGALKLFDEMKKGTPLGKELGQGTARYGALKNAKRIPTVKSQAMAAYDPRGLKGTGVTYATSPMGADHTCGNTLGDPSVDPHSADGQAALSAVAQGGCAMIDCLGICLFAGMAITPPEGPAIVARLLEATFGETWTGESVFGLGLATLERERSYNRLAGFTPADDDVPAFVRTEPLAPHNSVFDVPKEEMEKHCSPL